MHKKKYVKKVIISYTMQQLLVPQASASSFVCLFVSLFLCLFAVSCSVVKRSTFVSPVF